jgi:hypothetical protein
VLHLDDELTTTCRREIIYIYIYIYIYILFALYVHVVGCSMKICKLYYSPTVMVIKSRKMELVRHVACT